MDKKIYERAEIYVEKSVEVISTSLFEDDDALEWDPASVSYGKDVDYSSFRLD